MTLAFVYRPTAPTHARGLRRLPWSHESIRHCDAWMPRFFARAESAYVPDTFPIDSAAVARTIILLEGPSGSGKSRLTHMADLPELRLDDFYRDHDEPGLPMVRDMVDWDDVSSWNLPVAVEALGELATTGHTVVPCYDISRSRADGNHVVEVGDARAVVAEGIFAPRGVWRSLDGRGGGR